MTYKVKFDGNKIFILDAEDDAKAMEKALKIKARYKGFGKVLRLVELDKLFNEVREVALSR